MEERNFNYSRISVCA